MTRFSPPLTLPEASHARGHRRSRAARGGRPYRTRITAHRHVLRRRGACIARPQRLLALEVELGEPQREPTELLVPLLVPAALAFDMACRGEVNDGESALALLLCERAVLEYLGRRPA